MAEFVPALAGVCRDDMKHYLWWLAPRLILVLETSEVVVLEQALPCIAAFGNALQDYFHHFLPVFWNLLKPHRVQKTPVKVQRDILNCLKQLLTHLHVPELGSGLLLPLVEFVQCIGRSENLVGEVMDVATTMAMAVGPDGKAFFDCIKQVSKTFSCCHCCFLRFFSFSGFSLIFIARDLGPGG